SFRLIDAILAVAHPKLNKWASAVIQELCTHEEILDFHGLIKEWPLVFTAITIVQNREMPLHRDPKSMPRGYNVFLSIGSYEEAILALPTLGIQSCYTPGSVLLCSGLLMRHGVSIAEHRKRISYVLYMRPSIFDYVLVPQPPQAIYDTVDI
ncbi:hypothetical protein BS17DRAFT_696827, partial [Gyrodon lividus]